MMAWAIFHQDCNWSRPKSIYSFSAKASPKPQERPHDFIDYCVKNGWATNVDSPSRDEKRAIKGRRKI